MMKDITLGQYFPGNSLLHRLDPRMKLVLTLCFIVLVFLPQNWWGLLAVGLKYNVPLDVELADPETFNIGQSKFMEFRDRFLKEFGATLCPELHKQVYGRTLFNLSIFFKNFSRNLLMIARINTMSNIVVSCRNIYDTRITIVLFRKF